MEGTALCCAMGDHAGVWVGCEARGSVTNSQRQCLPLALIKSPLTSSALSPGAQLDSELVITADKDLSKWEMCV